MNSAIVRAAAAWWMALPSNAVGASQFVDTRLEASNTLRDELEADCYAASRLAVRNPAAVRAAIEFFTRLGPVRFDRVHPSGEQRAAAILACASAGPG
jgi:hypothetical protein